MEDTPIMLRTAGKGVDDGVFDDGFRVDLDPPGRGLERDGDAGGVVGVIDAIDARAAEDIGQPGARMDAVVAVAAVDGDWEGDGFVDRDDVVAVQAIDDNSAQARGTEGAGCAVIDLEGQV